MSNCWSGTPSKSDQQKSERSQRAAKRFIRTLPKSDSEDDNFEDCDTSFNRQVNLDGADDLPDEMAAAELARQKALPVSESDFDNDEDSWKKEVKVKFDQNDVPYWFNSVEAQMKKYGINRQWDKKNSIALLLPDDILEEVKPILRLTEAEAGPHIYKDLREEIVSLARRTRMPSRRP